MCFKNFLCSFSKPSCWSLITYRKEHIHNILKWSTKTSDKYFQWIVFDDCSYSKITWMIFWLIHYFFWSPQKMYKLQIEASESDIWFFNIRNIRFRLFKMTFKISIICLVLHSQNKSIWDFKINSRYCCSSIKS